MFLGIELRQHSVNAVLIDDAGRVVKRDAGPRTDVESTIAVINAASGDHDAPAGIAVRGTAAEQAAVEALRTGPRIQIRRVMTPGAAAAIAEHWTGAAAGHQSVVVLNIGESVDAGIVINGSLLDGTHGVAGSAGWLALNPVEREDYRRLGCLEAEVGEAGIVRRLVWRIKSGDNSRALDLAGGSLQDLTVLHIFDAARQGDGVAISVVRDTAKYIGMALANFASIVDPELIVVAGSIASAGDLLLGTSRTEMQRRIPPGVELPVVLGVHGDASAAIGAARAAMLAA